jgi:hypothetical protein
MARTSVSGCGTSSGCSRKRSSAAESRAAAPSPKESSSTMVRLAARLLRVNRGLKARVMANERIPLSVPAKDTAALFLKRTPLDCYRDRR